MSCSHCDVSRRHFIHRLGRWCLTLPGIVVLAGLMQGAGARKAQGAPGNKGEVRISLTEHLDLQRAGGFVPVNVDNEPVIIFRDEGDAFRAVSRVCTHRGCTVDWVTDSKTFVCPCHGSVYDRTGVVSRGPARRNLSTFNAIFDRDDNTVVLKR